MPNLVKRKSSLQQFLLIVVFASVAIPALLTGFVFISENYNRTVELDSRVTANNYIDLLQAGMTMPLWNVKPELGQPLMDSISIDSSVLKVEIKSENGDVFIEPLNGAPGERQQIGTIGTSLGGSKEDPLIKSLDGHLRLSSGGVPGADQAAVLSQGFLEGSNIDAVSELIGTMEDQRQFEINIKLISLSKEIDEGGSSIMRLPS